MILNRIASNQVVWMLPWNRGGQALSQVKVLAGNEWATSFAKTEIGISDYTWTSALQDLVSYVSLSIEEQSYVSEQLKELLSVISSRVDAEMAGRILTVPSEEYVYFSRGAMKVVIAGWGFRMVKRNTDGVDRWQLPPDENRLVRIAFVRGDEVLQHRNFLIKNRSSMNRHQTGSDGYYSIGMLKIGTLFEVVDEPTDTLFQIEVKKLQQDYLLDIYQVERKMALETDYDILVVDQDGTSVPEYTLMVNGFASTTDGDGIVRRQSVPFTLENNKVNASDGTRSCQYELSKDKTLNHFKFPIERSYASLRLRVISDNGEVNADGYDVDVSFNGEKERHTVVPAGKNGEWELTFSNIAIGTKTEACLSAFPNVADSMHLQEGENEIVLRVPKVDPLPPPIPDVRVGLHDIDGSPIRNTDVQIALKSGVYHLRTDDDGNVFLPLSNFTNKERARLRFKYKRESQNGRNK